MTEEQRVRYKQLKQKHKNLMRQKYIEHINKKFEEFGRILGNDVYIFYMKNEERLSIYEKCYKNFSFRANASRLDESKLNYFNIYYIKSIDNLYNNKEIFKECKYKEYYIICGKDFPIIKCNILKFFNNEELIYEINLVNTECLILLSENFKQIVYIYHGSNVMIGEI